MLNRESSLKGDVSFYFEVNPTQGISEAMNALFQKAISDARIAS